MSETRDFLVPDLGEGLDDLTIVGWHVAVGDAVELNQDLCTVETAKAEVDVPSPYAGTVVALGGGEGETLDVGTLLVRIETRQPAAPAARAEPAPPTGAPPLLVGYGPDAGGDRSRRAAPAPATVGGPAARPRAKPPVRLLARQHGIDLRDLMPGSGPDGIVTRDDVLRSESGETRGRMTTIGLPVSPVEGAPITLTGVQARMAQRLADAHRDIPDAAARVVVDCTRLLDARDRLNAHAATRGLDGVVTPFTLLAHLAVVAVRASPKVNAMFEPAGPAVRLHDALHLGIATATDRGLVVTVVRDAGGLGAHPLAAEVARLSGAARAGTAAPAELSGSTFTITNFGALGLDDGIPMINPPEAAILGVGAIRRRPHVVDDEVMPRSTATLTLVFDHRVLDGAEAGRYLGELRALIEAPELALF
jgi:2-oxoisovalerate dehydrogenase E2 component (dihydrolipoyl transacylase)